MIKSKHFPFSLPIVRLGFFCILAIASVALPAQCPTLVWADEFNGTALDLNKWTPQIGDGCDIGLCGWGNNELQYYKSENAVVSGGTLKIIAKKERVRGSSYTSARLRTINKGDWTYGRFEARMKLPYGQGMWPAFWMLPTDEVYGGWPQSGEIDIMELVGREPNRAHGTIHYGPAYPNNQSQGNSFTLNSGIFNDAFHTFAIEWEPNVIRWYIDDYLYSTKTSADLSPYNWPFNQRFHFLLNLAVGGNWPGSPDATTVFPQTLEVDYVRVYSGTFPHITGNRTVAYQAQNEAYTLNNVPSGSTVSWSVPAGASIASGQGTNNISVNWGSTGGNITATITTGCYSRQIVLNVAVEPAFVKEFSFENFDQAPNMTFISTTGTLTEDVANPGSNTVNNSALCGRYVRNSSQQYDVLQYGTTSITNASLYYTNQKKFYIDIYTNAPPNTLILLQLENSATATSSNYPTGRHSRYQAFTTVQNQWQRLALTPLDQPDPSTPNTAVNRFVFLYASNSFNGSTFHWDNFDSYAVAGTNQPPTVSITAPADNTAYNSLQTIAISANAVDSDGSVTQVEFFVNGGSIGTDNTTPYSINWTIPAFGSYQLTARATDNQGANTTSAPVNITASGSSGPTYCTSQGTSFNNEWIAGVSIGSFNNTSGKTGYSDFTSLTATLSPGTHNLTLTPAYSGPSRKEYWRIWIDYNADGDFTDAGELAYDAGSAQSGVLTGILTIPSSAAGVTTRIRVSMKRDAAPTSCETFARGEVEDYTLSVPSALLSGGNSVVSRTTGLYLFPNPVSNNLTVSNGFSDPLTMLIIYDLNGKEVLRRNERVESMQIIDLEINMLQNGVYLLRGIRADGQTESVRFVKF